jgi:phosphoglycerate dehydrogenase-like enzyme
MKEFAKMKRGIVIVDIARGSVMYKGMLVAAVDSGTILSAELDV